MKVEISNQSLRNGIVLLVVACGALAMAAPFGGVPNPAQTAMPISASGMNSNFEAVADYMNSLNSRLEIIASYHAIYVGPTPQHYNGQLGGYTGANAKCRAAVGSQTAHMCSATQILHSIQQGQNPIGGLWYATGVAAVGPGALTANDCFGWSVGDSSTIGATWHNDGTAPSQSGCGDVCIALKLIHPAA